MSDYQGNANSPSDFEDFDLGRFDDDFANAPIEDREFDPVPDGNYQVNVEKVELTRSQKSGNPMLKWTLRILGPRSAKRLLWHHNVLLTPENIKWLKNDLHTAGLDLAKASDLKHRLGELLDVKLEITKRTKGENENVYLNRRIVLGTNGGEPPDDRTNAALTPF
jgi:hypothetical protein